MKWMHSTILNAACLTILREVERDPYRPIADIATALTELPTTVQYWVRKMEELGLVEVRNSLEDNRMRLVSIRPAGQKAVRAASDMEAFSARHPVLFHMEETRNG